MRARGIERNVHTFSALMNVCIKCGQYKLALDVYREMRQEVGTVQAHVEVVGAATSSGVCGLMLCSCLT